MAYVRKTIDRWDIETNWGYGWDVEVSEYTLREAKQTFREYRLNYRVPVRLVKRREKLPTPEVTGA